MMKTRRAMEEHLDMPVNADEAANVDHSEDKRQYLSFIQGIIDRLANNSAGLKQWLAGILALLIAWAGKRNNACILYGGVLVTVAFWAMDAQYLKIERAYRSLYRKAVSGENELYDLDWLPYGKGMRKYLHALFSWSTAYYPALIAAIMMIYWIMR